MENDKKIKVYVSGKITGLPKIEYLQLFRKAAERLFEEGYSVINPAVIQALLPEDTTYEQYMQMSLLELSFCDAIYMLRNWQDSNGAKKELEYARRHGYRIMYEVQP